MSSCAAMAPAICTPRLLSLSLSLSRWCALFLRARVVCLAMSSFVTASRPPFARDMPREVCDCLKALGMPCLVLLQATHERPKMEQKYRTWSYTYFESRRRLESSQDNNGANNNVFECRRGRRATQAQAAGAVERAAGCPATCSSACTASTCTIAAVKLFFSRLCSR